jgi:D-3-phosphoglycerate dehydrogenase / 2-oxoglutarate reductase
MADLPPQRTDDGAETVVLVSAPYLIPSMARFRPLFESEAIEIWLAPVEERLEEEALLHYAGKVDGVICGDDRFSARVLRAAAPRLKVISKWGTGIDSIDREAARQLGIQVHNTPGAFTQAVADTVMGYMLCFARRLVWMDQAMKAGRWEKLHGRALHECTLGVIGVGNCGKAVLGRARAFGMRLLGNDILPIDPGFLAETVVQMVDLETLLDQSDFISVNCDLNPTSYHLLTAARMARARPGAILINCARGPVVDEAALVAALAAGRLGGAALDVFEAEPLPAGSPLRRMENVLLAPHNANSSPTAWEQVHVNTIRNLFLGLGRTWKDPA